MTGSTSATVPAPAGPRDASLSIAVARYPYTERLLSGSTHLEGCTLEPVEVEPIHRAFAPMVRELRYDVAELALVTLLQAVEAGVPVVPLPVVLHGNFHHRSLWVWAGDDRLEPGDLRGRRVGVRAYSQTTALWVRGVLLDTYGVHAQEVTWVTREGPHVLGAPEPAGVERTDRPLVDALRAGEVDAVLMGARSVDHVDGLEPLIPDWELQQRHFLDQHGWVPANHLAVVRRDLLENRPDLVRTVYRALTDGIDAVPTGPAVRHGVDGTLLAVLDTAIRHAREQGLIGTGLSAEGLFGEFLRAVGDR